MVILISLAQLLEIAIFLFAVVAFVLALRFFMDSRRRLQESFPGLFRQCKHLAIGLDRSGFLIPKTASKKAGVQRRTSLHLPKSTLADNTTADLKDLRLQLQSQQQELAKALQQISHLSHQVPPSTEPAPAAIGQKKLLQLQLLLEEKEGELHRLKTQDPYTQKLHDRLEEVQAELAGLQEKLQEMEKQSWQAAELTIQLENATQAQMQAEKVLQKKEEKLRDLTLENQQLREDLNELEDKLSEANLQRQQLIRKVQLLEGFNADMMQIAEANRKLKTEMARMTELESMLQMMKQNR